MSDKTHKSTKPASDREAYYARATSWAQDGQEKLRQSRRIAWLVAGIACSVALFAVIAIALMMPLKTVVPYTLLVDRTTGYVQLLKGDGRQTLAPDEALTKSLLAQYVIAREEVDVTSVQANYRKVGLWSADRARSDYIAMMAPTNPASPFQRLPRTTVLSVRIKSVSPMGPGAAQIRFETERRDQGQSEGPKEAWVAIIRYRFVDAAMSMDDRLINPLGFQVLRYRRDQESPEPVVAVSTPVPQVQAAPVGGLPVQANIARVSQP
ncbi:VirB8/TrbF family protein [Sphingobium sp. BYY-5]|uniref:virB8 family protein n=1 Tax=Sphingobium sp. BYY-5 TaxID=2926400 RepID=UPI001FA792DD|nr:type IV secretion system protein [Sphingobium sp. BYY-5]MCI4590395.1 VirB8/TrbF family protein [Sphingobium sp. BYY-5]MCI4591489.1 VirB8/TrbF family protein [Sphingobium sp. BYY-5]